MYIDLTTIDLCPGQGGGGVRPSGTLEISGNGLYDVYSYASASVSVHPSNSLSETYTSNGSYIISGEFNGGEITVEVPAPQFITETLNVSVNNTYYPGPGINGFSEVVVSVPGFTEKEITEKSYEVYNLNNSASFVASANFQSMSTIQTINLPNCEWVGTSAFDKCSSLSEIYLPNCVGIWDCAFRDCPLQTLNLPNCEWINTSAFMGCSSLSEISIPNCSNISLYAFAYCSSLRSINLPKCEFIGQAAFDRCSSLSEISVPNCSYLQDTFANTSISYLELPMLGTLGIGYNGFGSIMKTLSICRDVALIPATNGQQMTYQFSNLETIYVPSDTYDLFVSKFSSHSSKFVSFALSGGPLLSFSNGLLYGSTRGLNSTVWEVVGASKSDLTAISLPNCEYLSDYYGTPFVSCSNLSVVSLPKCKELISFTYCRALQEVYLPDVTIIGNSTFYGCRLSEIDLPKCKQIGQYAFTSCQLGLIKLSVCSYIAGNAFSFGITSDVSIYLYSNKVCVLDITNPFNRSYANIYVPASLVDVYKSASIWSYASDRIFPIE